MLEGAEELIMAVKKLKEIYPDWKLIVTSQGGEKSEVIADELIRHLELGDEFAQNLLNGLGEIGYALLAGSGAPRPRKGPLTNQDVLSAIEIIKKIFPPSNITVVSLKSEQP